MSEKISKSQKLVNFTDILPEFCTNYFTNHLVSKSINTQLAYANDLKNFFNYLIFFHPYFYEKEMREITKEDMQQITPTDINRFVARFIKSETQDPLHKSYNTAARRKACLSTFFDFLYNTLQCIDKNPVNGAANIKVPTKDFIDYLNPHEQEKFLNTVLYGTGLNSRQLKYHEKLKSRDYTLFALALDTGLRISEISGINIYDIDIEECSIIVQRKGRNISKIYFSDIMKIILENYLEEKRSLHPFDGSAEPLFATANGNRLSVRQIQETFTKYIQIALPNRKNLTFHKLRASFAMSFLEASGNNLLLTKEKLGHGSLKATEHYVTTKQRESRDSRNAIQDMNKSNKS